MIDNEIVDIVNEQGNVLYQTSKIEAHTKGLLHKTVIAQLVNGKGERLLIRPVRDKQDAGQYVSPVGGHVMAGESEDDALKREVQEEIGINEFTSIFKGYAILDRFVCGRQENHFFCMYEIYSDAVPELGNEADSMRWFTERILKDEIKTKRNNFGDAFHFVIEHFYPQFLH